MILGDLLTAIGCAEFISVYDMLGNAIIEDEMNGNDTYKTLLMFLETVVTDIDTGITNSHGSLHAVIGIQIDEIYEGENE
ncbi:hypothetical protein NNG48_06985 [Enterococcus faecium]|nr:hypothetical protein [Enterococcus faecium]